MIHFEKYDIFKEKFTTAFNHFTSKVNGHPYDGEKLNLGSDRDYCGEFGDEFRANIYSHSLNDSNLGQYIREVYYNGAAYLTILYSDLHWKYFHKFGVDNAYEDLTQNLTSPVSLLATYMEKEAFKLGFKELIPFDELSFDDYDFSGNYKGIFNWKIYDKEKYVTYFNIVKSQSAALVDIPKVELTKDIFIPDIQSDTIFEPLNTASAATNIYPKPSPSPDEIYPKIYISPIMQTRLFKTLSEKAPINQRTALELLLTNGYSESRVWIKLKAESLSYVFKLAKEVGDNTILANKKEIANWLAAYFNWGKTKEKPVRMTTVYNVLRENKIVNKGNQIRLKP